MTSASTMATSETTPNATYSAVRDARCKTMRNRIRVTAQNPLFRCTAQHGWHMYAPARLR